MATKRIPKSEALYERVFFDRLLLAGVIFLSLGYITQGSWVSPLSEAAAIAIGFAWAYRVATSADSKILRLVGALVGVLIWGLMVVYLAAMNGLLG